MTVSQSSLIIDGVTHSVILRYFETINKGDFAATAQLFTSEGVLKPPFEVEVIGKEAITHYLETHAKGLQLYPQQGNPTILNDNYHQIDIIGKAEVSIFKVNISWKFTLDSHQKIASVVVKLLASPQELLQLGRLNQARLD